LEGAPGDDFGIAGYCVPPMQREKLADRMEVMCESRELRLKMGEIAKKRAHEYYRYSIMLNKYKNLYKEVEQLWQV
ncbi:MAG: glycosyl transferase, partial [Clostridia bacterium]|nr:glycosyl transferase [Clostridia bacterium]